MIKRTAIGTGVFLTTAALAASVAFAQTDTPTVPPTDTPTVTVSPSPTETTTPTPSTTTLPSGAPATGRGL